jgi:cytochrome oxidase Cu insertion factor (SCO1/SenC/PrrC family)
MFKKLLSLTLMLLAAGIAAAQSNVMPKSQTQTQTPTQPPAKTAPVVPHTNLKVGDKAPEFALRATDGKSYKLSDFKGQKNVVLAIYVLAFTGG